MFFTLLSRPNGHSFKDADVEEDRAIKKCKLRDHTSSLVCEGISFKDKSRSDNGYGC